MRIALITDSISPHQIPFSDQLAKQVGQENFRYICDVVISKGRSSLGWQQKEIPKWVIITNSSRVAQMEAYDWKINSDVIISAKRDYKLYKKRTELCRLTLYMSERWFKPPWFAARLIFPHYFFMAMRIVILMKSEYFYYLPIGIHAATDMFCLYGLFNIKPKYLRKKIVLEPIHKVPFSNFIVLLKNRLQVKPFEILHSSDDIFIKHMLLWGYFVGKSSHVNLNRNNDTNLLKIIWVGRLLSWKKVDSLIIVVKSLIKTGSDIQLTIIGNGPQKKRLKRLALLNREDTKSKNLVAKILKNRITFLSPVAINEVRKHMQNADIYILPSNANEGWGAVINEAMEEGCAVIASRESGAGITMIENGKNGLLFRSGNIEELKRCIVNCYGDRFFLEMLKKEAQVTISTTWGVEQGAEKILCFIKEFAETKTFSSDLHSSAKKIVI